MSPAPSITYSASSAMCASKTTRGAVTSRNKSMGLRVALQMDEIASIDPRIESTFLLGLEAQRRGHALWYYTPEKLSWLDGKIIARARPLTLRPNPNDY